MARDRADCRKPGYGTSAVSHPHARWRSSFI